MKLMETEEQNNRYVNVVAYKDKYGNLVINPKYFSTQWRCSKDGKFRTGYIDDGVIYPPCTPEYEREYTNHETQKWEPECYPDYLFYTGCILSFTFE